MAKKFFRKELVSNSFLVKGKQVPFEIVEGNRGLIALDETPENADLISALEEFSSKRKYGVVVVSEAEYLEKKKLLKSVQPPKRKLEKLKVMQPLLKPKSPSPEKAVPVVNPVPSAPVTPPPTTNKDGELAAGAPAFVPRTAPKPDAETKPVTK